MNSFHSLTALTKRLATLSLVFLAISCVVRAEEPETEEDAGLLVRKIYVPAKKPDAWPTAGDAYLPIDATRLDELLQNATRESEAGSAAVARTVLYASLEEDEVLVGRGVLEVVPPQNVPGWLRFAPSQLHLMSRRWRGTDEDALLGYWGEAAEMALRVNEQDSLGITWRLPPLRQAANQREYALTLPAALTTTLVVDLPADETPEPISGTGTLVTLATSPSGKQQLRSRQLAELQKEWPTPAAGMTRWVLTCGPSGQIAWRSGQPGESRSAGKPLPLITELLRYKIDQSGMELNQRTSITVSDELPKSVPFSAPSELVVIAARLDGEPLRWTFDAEGEIYRFAVPAAMDAIKHGTYELEIEAWRPVQLATPWQLPQFSSPDLFWSAGRVEVELDESLQIGDVTLRSMQQAASPGDNNAPWKFQKLRPSGSLELMLSRQPPQVEIAVGRVIELSGVGSKASIVSRIHQLGASRVHAMEARLVGDWELQSVTSLRPGQIDDWYVTEDAPGVKTLTVRLESDEKAITSRETRSVDLIIEAKRQVSERDPWLPFSEYVVLDWLNAEIIDDFMTFESDEGYQIEYSRQPAAVTDAALLPHLGTLLPASPTGDVFDLRSTNPTARVHLSRERAAYDADLIVEVTEGSEDKEDPERGIWKRICRITCSPRSGLVDRLHVSLPTPNKSLLRWKLDGAEEWRLADKGQIVSVHEDDWELILPQPKSTRFTVMLDLGVSHEPELVVQPVRLPDANRQSSQILVRSNSVNTLAFEANDLTLLSADVIVEKEGLHSAWLATSGVVGSVEGARLVLRRVSVKNAPPRARIRRATLESTYAPDSHTRHRYRFTLYNSGESELQCQLPESAADIRWRRESAEEPVVAREANFTIPVEHSLDEQAVRYLIEFTTLNEPLADRPNCHAPWPSFSVPVEVGEWQVRFPREFEANSPQLKRYSSTWQERLFGPLAGVGVVNRGLASDAGAFHSIQLLSVHQRPLAIQFSNVSRRSAGRVLALVLAMGIGYGLWRRPTWFVAALALTAITALVAPAAWSGWATACWGGLIASAAVKGLQAAWEGTSSLATETTGDPVSVGFLITCMSFAAAASADATAQQPMTEHPTIENLLIPVDEAGNPTTERYVTPRLMRELLQREQSAQAQRDWLITSAMYEGAIGPDVNDAPFTESNWTLAFDLQLFRRNVTVELPLRESDARWEPVVLLDGVATELAWSDDGFGCRFVVREPGRYRVKLHCQPKLLTEDKHHAMRLRIPPLPGAKLWLDAAPQLEGLQVAERPLSGEREALLLDSSTDLRIRWRREAPDDTDYDWRLEQFEWMHVGESSVYVDYLLRLRGAATDLPPLELESDTLARLVHLDDTPTSIDGATSAEETTGSDWRRTWNLSAELDATDLESTAYVARFRLILDRDGPLGRLRFPNISLRGIPKTSSKQAISHSDNLSVAIDALSPLTTEVDLEEFASHWPGKLLPNLAVAATTSDRPIVVSVRPTPSSSPPEESLHLGSFEDRIRVLYQGDYPEPVRPRFYQTVRVTPDLKVSAVEVNQNGKAMRVRYTRPRDNRLVVFFPEAVNEPFRLSVHGSLPLSESGATDVPLVTSWTHPPATQRLQIFSAPRFATKFTSDDPPTTLSDLPLVPPEGWKVYGEGAYQFSPRGTTPLALSVEPLKSRFDVKLCTTLVRAEGNWIAQFGLDIDVLRGALTELTLDFPESLVSLPEIVPPAYVDWNPAARGGKRSLTLRFPQAIRTNQPFRTTIRCAIEMSDEREVVAPVIGIRRANDVQRYFGILPISDGSWSWSDAEPVEGQSNIESLLVDWPDARILRATSDRHAQVRWTANQKHAQASRLPIAEVEAQLSPGGVATLRTCIALPRLEVQECQIDLPENAQLLSARVDGAMAVVQASPDGAWKLTLPGPQLPHVVDLVTVTNEKLPTSGPMSLQLPRLSIQGMPLEMEHCLWSVTDLRAGSPLSSTSAETLSDLDRAALRLNQLLRTASSAGGRSDEGIAWAECWARVLDDAAEELRQARIRALPRESDIVDPTPEQTEFDELLDRASGRIDALRDRTIETVSVRTVRGVWPTAHNEDASGWRQFVVTGDNQLPLVLSPRAPSGRGARWSLAGTILVFATLFVAITRRVTWTIISEAWVFPLAMLIGFAWWLWLWPSWLGLVIAAAATLAWLRWYRHHV